ncbi:hypothetical protein [Roseibaca sp. Y0-43]|uniref:hypothetical protein n=1 Tax=Roseibaca sp. Y0-43 TaxID=2816854 RepID=UPI001D0C853F|nr:hypothetical protein [Roseibaca sp. Y0-43]MCC1482363.1 hypothetical protein [Roseibaca sp. Y0-43]
MEILADIAIGSGALLAAAYCLLLSRRLRAFTRLDGDVGRAIAVLSSQVDQLTRALSAAESGAAQRESTLGQQIAAAEQAARRLELLMAADRPKAAPAAQTSAVAPDSFWGQGDDTFEPLERSRAPEHRLRTTRARVGSRT